MTEQPTQTSRSKPNTFPDLLAGSAEFVPHKMAVSADVNSGDTILSDAVVAGYDETALKASLEGWRTFAGEQDPSSSEGKSRLALAKKAIAEHLLISHEYGQVLGEVDHSRDIGDLQQTLHPYYSPALYQTALAQKIKTVESAPINPADYDARTGQALLLDTLDGLRDGSEAPELIKPTPETLEKIGRWQRRNHQAAMDFVDTLGKETLAARDIKAAFDKAIELSDSLREAGWRAEVEDTEKTAITVYPIERRIVIPAKRQADKATVKALVEHEVYGHALRAANAVVVGNEVGAVGTARQNSFEESLMIALEQTFNGQYDPERGVNHYLSVGMSVTGKLPAEEIGRLFNAMHQLKDGKIMPDAVAAAQRLSEGQLKRTFAGMTDVDDGIANRSIIDYMHGLNDAWNLLNYLSEHDVVDEGMDWLMSARFNPYDADDRELVEAYHPMPDILKAYFA